MSEECSGVSAQIKDVNKKIACSHTATGMH